MKGTFREVLNFYATRDWELDAVIGDEEMGSTFSFCGKPKFSKYCEEKYGELLNANAEVREDPIGKYTDAVIVDYSDAEKGSAFTMAWAGYVSETEYNKLFEED